MKKLQTRKHKKRRERKIKDDNSNDGVEVSSTDNV